MNFREYQDLAEVTINKELNYEQRLAMIALGFGESGEAQNEIKKHLYHGHKLDLGVLSKELGDMLWYIATMCNTFGIPLEVIAMDNIAKLKERYPEGFSEEASRNRKENNG